MLPDLVARLRWWQEKLRLRDWEIDIFYVDDLEIEGIPVWGACDRFPDDRRATIRVRTPKNAAELAEVEETVVHELLHCLLAPLGGYEGATRTAEEQAVWTLSPLLVQLGDSARGKILARAIPRVLWRKLAAGRTRSSGRTRTMDPKLAELLRKLLEMDDPADMKAMIATVLETFTGGAGEESADVAAAAQGDEAAGAEQMAESAPPEGAAGGEKPYQRKVPSLAVQALAALVRSRVESPRKSKEERCRELRLPADITAMAVKLGDEDFECFVEQVTPVARQSGPARQATQGGIPGGAPASPRGMTPERARAGLSPDQVQGLARAFGRGVAKASVSRDAFGRLITSHVGDVPEGATVIAKKEG